MQEMNTSLYWSMPGPCDFVGRVSDASRNARAIILSLTDFPPNGIWDAVRRGLTNANVFEPLELSIFEGMNVDAEIGSHFKVQTMPGNLLAHHRHGQQHAVILKPAGKSAAERCQEYAAHFLQNIEHADGDVRLIISVHDGSYTSDQSDGRIHVIAFDGGLNESEMDAYVTQRLVTSYGPGSTRLVKQLITEFSGFDVCLAEALIGMGDADILSLPEPLTKILGHEGLRWMSDSWVNGSTSSQSGSKHPLREWYLASHPGETKDFASRAIKQRYWRACVRTLLPWLEERRPQILEMLDDCITALEKSSGGPGKIKKMQGAKKEILISREDMEYNDLWFNFKDAKHISSKERLAIAVCLKTKLVRDELSHLRKPQTADIMALISDMDTLIP